MVFLLSIVKKYREITILTLLVIWGVGLFTYANSLYNQTDASTNLKKDGLHKECVKKVCPEKDQKKQSTC